MLAINWFWYKSKYWPFCFNSSLCVPFSTIIPLSITKIASAFWIVDKRWAIIIEVLDLVISIVAFWMYSSEKESIDEVASSRINNWGL